MNTGEVVSGDPASGQRLVTGDTVNVAARLEQAATAGEVLLGEPTYRLVKDAVQVDVVAPLELKGKAERVPAFRLGGVLADTAGHVRHLDSPMVGRSKELELFRRGLERARDERTCHLFTLLGSAGVGKSRLVREFLAGADATVLRGRCLSYGEGITYYAVGEIVRTGAQIPDGADGPTALAALERTLIGAEEEDRIARLVGGLFGWADAAGPDDAAWGLRKLLEHLAKDRPLVVVIDDLHWAEPLLLDLIEHLADWTRDAELLLVCIARPELLEVRSGWGGGKLNATSILLEPLAGDDAAAMMSNLLGDADLPPTARDRILAAAEGNPLFVEEMIGMLIDDGLIRFEDGAWTAVDDLASLTVPPTIQLLLSARLDRLDAEERAVIERGAVEGKVFHTGAVTSLAPEGLRTSVRPRLMALARKELIRPDRAEFAGEDAFRFRHMLIRDAAYEAMPKEQRAELHEGFARWLTTVSGDRLSEYQEILGHHLEQAYRYRSELGPADDRTRALAKDAARALHASADRATERDDLAAAARLLERTIALSGGFERARATVELGEALRMTGRHGEAIDVLDAFALSPDGPRWPALRIRADVGRLMSSSFLQPDLGVRAGYERAATLLDEAEQIGDDQAITACLLATGVYSFWLGRCATSAEISTRLLPRLDELTSTSRGQVLNGLIVNTYFGATPIDEGFSVIELMRGLVGDGFRGRVQCATLAGALYSMADDEEAFEVASIEVDSLLADSGRWDDMSFMFRQSRGECLARIGRLDEARSWFRDLKVALDDQGEVGFNSTVTGVLATYEALSGQIDQAAVLIQNGYEMSPDDDFGALVPLSWAGALVASARGEHDAALAAIDEGIELISVTDYLVMHADTLRYRGQVLEAAGRREEADVSFDEALAMYERKGDTASARRLRSWRGEHGSR